VEQHNFPELLLLRTFLRGVMRKLFVYQVGTLKYSVALTRSPDICGLDSQDLAYFGHLAPDEAFDGVDEVEL
jgi:hypothetical protein